MPRVLDFFRTGLRQKPRVALALGLLSALFFGPLASALAARRESPARPT